jgi:phosphoglycolate phosphatase
MISSDGAGRRAIRRVLTEAHSDLPDEAMQITFSGKTDPQIFTEIATLAKLPYETKEELLEKFLTPYLKALGDEISKTTSYKAHKGVLELLEALVARKGAYLGLLTGNVETGARMKLEQFDFNRYFPIGSYGSDSANRLELPEVAAKRASEFYKLDFAPHEIVIIGDSTNDVLCAHGYGARCIAVNTGKTSWKDLEDLKPEFLFKSLVETENVVNAIFS